MREKSVFNVFQHSFPLLRGTIGLNMSKNTLNRSSFDAIPRYKPYNTNLMRHYAFDDALSCSASALNYEGARTASPLAPPSILIFNVTSHEL